MPLVWRVIGGIAIGITILASAGYIVTFIKELFMLGVICFFFIGFAVTIFGGRWGPFTGFTKKERDEMEKEQKEQEWSDYMDAEREWWDRYDPYH